MTCQPGQNYIKVLKQNGLSHANEEGYTILNGNTVLVTNPLFVNNELRVNEYCLPAISNSVYSLKLSDSFCFFFVFYIDMVMVGIKNHGLK